MPYDKEPCKRHKEFDPWCSLCAANNIVREPTQQVSSAGSTGSKAENSEGETQAVSKEKQCTHDFQSYVAGWRCDACRPNCK